MGNSARRRNKGEIMLKYHVVVKLRNGELQLLHQKHVNFDAALKWAQSMYGSRFYLYEEDGDLPIRQGKGQK